MPAMNTKEMIEALEAKGITRYRIEKDTGINEKTLRNWLKGEAKKPNPFLVKALTDYYKRQIQA